MHLNPSLMKPAEYQRIVYMAAPPAGTTIEDMLAPAYWAHVGGTLKPGDRIEVMPEDMAFFAELLVRDAGQLSAHMTVLRHIEIDEAKASATAIGEYAVGWGGPAHRFRVTRPSDGAVIKYGFTTKADAARFVATMEPVAA